jgi:hypothetical protein
MITIFDPLSLKAYVDAFAWLITLGASEVKGAKKDIEQLIDLIAVSLLSFHDLAKEISRTEASTLTSKSFRDIHDYFRTFYFGQLNVSKARTHCGDVERQIDKITFRFARLLHTELGKWKAAKKHFSQITHGDGAIIQAFEGATLRLDFEFKVIAQLLNDRKTKEARARYAALRATVDTEADEINKAVTAMRKAYSHVQRIA